MAAKPPKLGSWGALLLLTFLGVLLGGPWPFVFFALWVLMAINEQ